MKKFAVILSGCGVFDGSEIHEAVLVMHAIAAMGAEYFLFAPNVEQHHVINHLSGAEMSEKRNILIESARIARGKIEDVENLDGSQFDAIIFPGGFGAAKNLSSFAFDGANCHIHAQVERVMLDFINNKKPIGAMCIAPVLFAKVLKDPLVTIGSDPDTVAAVTDMGAQHQNTTHGEVVYDAQYKLYSTPCYMLDASIVQIAEGANNLVKAMMKGLQ